MSTPITPGAHRTADERAVRRIAPHQPAFLPWLGYFARIIEADLFVALDSVQYEQRGWQNRNLICRGGRLERVTVPVRTAGRFGQRLCDTETDDSQPWRRRLLRTLTLTYGNQPCWDQVRAAVLSPVLGEDASPRPLADLNLEVITRILDYLGVCTPIVRLSSLGITSRRERLLVDLAEACGATEVIVGSGSEAYLGPLPTRHSGICFMPSRFRHPHYPQDGRPFVPNASVIDLLVRMPTAECRTLLTEAVA